MEPFNAGSGESLSDMANRCLSINQKSEKDAHISNLTAKYNTSKNVLQFSRSGTAPTQRACDEESSKSTSVNSMCEKSKSKFGLNFNSNILSSEDDSSDSDTPGSSLAALVAKHKMSKSIVNNCSENARKGDTHKNLSYQNKKEDFNSDSSSDNEEVSLYALASKFKSAQISGPNPTVTGITVTSTEVATLKSPSSSKSEIKFIAATFSSNSDSDEPVSLAGLIAKQKTTTNLDETRSSNDFQHLKPRELTDVASSHRYHTKSESDSFSPVSQPISDNLKNNLDNETSTSLGSLKGGIDVGKDFQFSIGCSIPNSFKSKHISCGLTSSLRSLRTETPQSSVKNSYSDPDVSAKLTRFSNPAQKLVFIKNEYFPVQDEKSPTDEIDIRFGGINLSSAIKSPSISKSSESATFQASMDISDEPQEVEIVTLFDHQSVDEEMNEDEKENVKDKREEECSFDASHILNVKVKLQTKKCSSFGKVICRQWKRRHIPYIREEKLKTTVVPFAFSTLSPDDEVASFLKKT